MQRHARNAVVILPILLTTMFCTASVAQFIQQGAKIVGTGTVGSAWFGHSVSLSADGNTAIVGALNDDANTGAAWIFTRSGGAWSQDGPKLVGSDSAGKYRQGVSAAMSGDGSTAIVGGWSVATGDGGAWVYVRSGGNWVQQGPRLVGSGAVGDAWFGHSVAISHDGNTAVVGGYADSGFAGAAWVFTRSAGTWSQQGWKLVGSGAVGPATQGLSVAMSGDGNTIIVGGSTDSGTVNPDVGIGAGWIFKRSGGVWTQDGGKLVGSGYAGPNPRQGISVAMSSDGNTAMIGGYTDDDQRGAAWVFTRESGGWIQQGGKLVGSDWVDAPRQGVSVSLSGDGNRAIIGGYYDDFFTGAAWFFERSGGTWTQQGSKIVGTGAVGPALQGRFVSISADGNTFITGGYGDNGHTGAAWVFSFTPPPPPVIYLPGWNIVSIDAVVPNGDAGLLFPVAASSPYSYDASYGYRLESELEPGPGYWVKFDDTTQALEHAGPAWTSAVIDVVKGWNLVGALRGAIHPSSIGSNPPGIVTSQFYRYAGGYMVADSLRPKHGYWVNVSQAGQLIMSMTGNVPGTIVVRPTAETPPSPPGGLSDVPGRVPASFGLSQNYPNPFNPMTRIDYSLREGARVRIRVLNVLGETVALLVDADQPPGTRSVVWDAREVPSGTYFYRISAGGYTETKKMTLIR